MNFADRLIDAIRAKNNPCVVGLDPRIDQMPNFIQKRIAKTRRASALREALTMFHSTILTTVAPLVPAVKPQIAFYEQYGLAGMMSFIDTVRIARELGLIVIVDAKSGDIPSTAQAYANAFLGHTKLPTGSRAFFNGDCLTVSPFLGRDSLEPFVDACEKFGKGLFVLVKTSNKGSRDFQDLHDQSRRPVYLRIARMVRSIGRNHLGIHGYSSIGAVVGATFPRQARELRAVMPNSIFLVPGYGSQGGTAKGIKDCFNRDGLGAVVSASRSITYSFRNPEISERAYRNYVRESVEGMVRDVSEASTQRQ